MNGIIMLSSIPGYATFLIVAESLVMMVLGGLLIWDTISKKRKEREREKEEAEARLTKQSQRNPEDIQYDHMKRLNDQQRLYIDLLEQELKLRSQLQGLTVDSTTLPEEPIKAKPKKEIVEEPMDETPLAENECNVITLGGVKRKDKSKVSENREIIEIEENLEEEGSPIEASSLEPSSEEALAETLVDETLVEAPTEESVSQAEFDEFDSFLESVPEKVEVEKKEEALQEETASNLEAIANAEFDDMDEDEKDSQEIIESSVDEENYRMSRIILRERKKFEAKISLANSSIRDYYNKVANFLMEYEGVTSFVEDKEEIYKYNDQIIARISTEAKELALMLALDPKEYENFMIHVHDALVEKNHSDTRAMVHIHSQKRLSAAQVLIGNLMISLDAYKNDDYDYIDYSAHYPVDTIENLKEKGFVEDRFYEELLDLRGNLISIKRLSN